MRTLLALGAVSAAACAAAGASQGPIDSSRPQADSSRGADSPERQPDAAIDAESADAARAVDGAVQVDAPVPIDAPRPIDAPSKSCASPFTGVLATWSFTGAPGDQTSTAASSTATGVVAGAVARSSGLTPTSGSGSINSSGWTENSSRDSSLYYTFTIAPPADCELDLTSLSIDAHSSATGPASAEVATSADGFAADAAVSTTAASTPSLSVSDAPSSIELRVYGFAASSTEGTMRLEATLSVTGAVH